MNCPQCGKENVDGAQNCAHCGSEINQKQTPVGKPAYIPNYLAPAVIVTFICCMPLGAVALIFAAQVNGRQIAGEYEKALESSKSARLWCWIAFGVGVVFWTCYLMLIIIIMILGAKGTI